MKKLISEDMIQCKVEDLALEISNNYKSDEEINVIVVLNGSFVFASDIIRELSLYLINIKVHFLKVRTYNGKNSKYKDIDVMTFPDPKEQLDIYLDEIVIPLFNLKDIIECKRLLVIEDILDSGKTLKIIDFILRFYKPVDIAYCVLLDKQKSDFSIDYKGFHIPDKFVIGYGLDYNENYRHLPYISII